MTRTLRQTGLPFILCTLLAAILTADASALQIKLGPVREQTVQWLMETRGISRSSAEQMMRQYARRNRADIIDSYEIPDGAVVDLVTIDPTKRGREQVEYEGCAQLFSPGSDYGQWFWGEIQKTKGTPSYDYFMKQFADAVERGVFVQKLTPEQKDRLLHAAKGVGGYDRPAAATPIRILVASFRMPPWNDRAQSTSNISHGHPMHPTAPWDLTKATQIYTTGQTPGGGWSNGQRVGLNSPAWSESHRGHDDPVNGADSFVYHLRTDFVEHWYTLMFDYSNVNSVANFYRANSHGNIAIQGDRGDIAAWLDSHHILDNNPYGLSRDETPMPGTPIIRDISGGNYIHRASVETGQFSVLFRDHWTASTVNLGTDPPSLSPAAGASLSNWRLTVPAGTAPDTPPYTPTAGTSRIDQTDSRHVTFTGVTWSYWDGGASPPQWRTKTVSNDTAFTLTYQPTGDTYSGTVGQGCARLGGNTTVTPAEATTGLLQSRGPSDTGGTGGGNRFKSLCYYTHDHDFNSKSGRPYQLSHIRNSRGYDDDIMGTDQSNLDYHIDRPAPYDHDIWDDNNRYTGGYFSSTAGHDYASWESACNQVMADWGISSAGYQRMIYVQPAGSAVPAGSRFIPNSSIVVPENVDLGTLGHELGHTFGMGDLYDKDFYANNASPPPSPPYFESDATGPYSIMGNGGLRVDPYHKIALGWVTPTTLETTPGSGVPKDLEDALIPEIEGNLQNPTVYKIVPDWATGNLTGAREYYLIENRNRNGASYFGDPSPRGLYVWHIDTRFGHTDEVYFSVITEQADGLYELERNPADSHGNMESDPFPGSLGIRALTQFGTVNSGGVKRSAPTTRSHGTPASRGVIVPGSTYDTFFRVDEISDAGADMTANIWVQPHELIVTAKDVAPATAAQGDEAVPVLGLHLKNSNVSPDLSTGDVVIREILIDESGSSKDDADTVRVLVYEDANGDGLVTSGTDVLLGTGVVADQQANITGLSYRVPANEAPPAERDLLICYDIANSATPGSTVGAGVDYAEPNIDPNFPRSAITCQIPGVIQERQRTGVGTWGFSRFPVRTPDTKTVIVESPDTLTITPTDLAPAMAIQGTPDVPMLGLRLRVDQDEVIVDGIKIDVSVWPRQTGDVSAKLYIDQNINGIIDPTDTVLDTATFYQDGTVPTALFDDLKSYTVVEGTDRGLIVAYDVASDAKGGDMVNVRLRGTGRVILRQPPSPSPQDVVASTNFSPPPDGMQSGATEIVENTPPTLVDHTGVPPSDGPPVVGQDWVIPQDGRPTDTFRWEATYTDAENQAPTFIRVVLDGVGYPMQKVSPGDTDYTDGVDYYYETTLPVGNHVYYMRCSDGKTILRYPFTAPDVYSHPVVSNPPPTLTIATGETDWWSPKQTLPPHDGTPRTTFTWRVIYTDVENEAPSPIELWLDGTAYAMTPANPLDTDYTDGAEFTYATVLAVGLHSYYLYTSDGTNNVRIPTTAPNTLTGPEVYDPPCTLTDRNGATTDWLSPTSGTPQTLFTWIVNYTDPESVPPTSIQVWIDGVGFDMTQTNPADLDYTDGARFRYQTTLPKGNHAYYVTANDGNNVVRFPTTAPDTYAAPVVTDDPCTLVDKNGGTTAWLTPEDGSPLTNFVWQATYTDAENQPPSSLLVNLDGTAYPMTQTNPADQDYTDGAVFRYQTTLPVGNHTYYISCSDGSNPLRFPATAPDTYAHPVVADPPCTLTDKNGGTTAWLNPKTGDTTTIFLWRAIYSDPEGVAPTAMQVWLDGVACDMTQTDPTDQDYIDGALFRYQTTLAAGSHSYYVIANDGNNTVRYPATGTYPFPTVTDPPLLLNDTSGGTTAWLTPTTGTPTTTFTWRAVYTDPQNDPPTAVQVWIDGTAYDLTQTNPADTDYTNGALFEYQTTGLTIATHSYYMSASDGTASTRFPTTAPDTYPEPVVSNTPPTLDSAAVSPTAGTESTAFTYSIVYTDADGHLPTYVQIKIDDGSWVNMTISPTELTPADPTDGNTYEYQSGLVGSGAHKARFRANDGYEVVYYPATGPWTGPVVLTPSNAFWADKTYAAFAGPYEEGDTVYMVVEDADLNGDVWARDTVDVTVRVLTGGDTETATLTESGAGTGVFQGSLPTRGATGASGNGTLNVVSGPTGNRLQLDYVDPNDAADTQTVTVRVTDTVAPAPVKTDELLAAPNVDGTVVNVDWTAYDEAAQIDVADYDVYFEPTPGNPIGGLTPVASPAAGTRTLAIPTSAPDGPMYVAVAVNDEVPNTRTDVRWVKVSTADKNPPVLQGESPADGSVDVPLNTNILFHIVDPGSGVSKTDIRVRIQQDPADGGGWTDVTSALDIQGDANAWTVTYDPPVDFLYNQHVTVLVTATDQFGNALQGTFSFDVTTDGDAPALQNADPANGDTNVPVDTDISFELTDAGSGVDATSIHVTVNGTDVSGGLQIGGTAALTTVLYNPPADFNWGETVTVTVDASDIAGNAMPTALYSFTILPDGTGTVIDQLTPADGATGVLIGTDISFRVYDAVSGVDTTSVELSIDGVAVTLSAANFKQLSPTAYLVTYDPPADFPYSTSVRVRATAKDLAGNPRSGVTWRFTTEPAPTYSITGTIEETVDEGSAATTVGVAGVAVKILDGTTGAVVKTVTTVGTGVFEATGLADGSYVVEPTLTDYTFTSKKSGKPTQRVYVGLQDTNGDGTPELDASGVDFDATRKLYRILGVVLEAGVGLPGVQVTDGARTATTDAQGQYRLEGVPSGTYSVTASLTNYTFSPTARRAVVASANATGVDFTAAAVTFSISGTIQDAAGDRLAGVKVEVQGGTSVAVTNAAGQYTLTGVKAGLRTLLVTRDGYVFEAAPGVDATDINVDSDLSGIDFVGYPVLKKTFTAGTHFVGVPATPRDNSPEAVFQTRDVARWVGTLSPPQYVTLRSNPDSPYLKVQPGRGFFVKYGQQTSIEVAGTPVPTTDPYVFVVDEGWSMAANPFASAIGFANLSPSASSVFAPYGFVLEGGHYTLVSDVAALGGRSWIDGWEGIWLMSDVQGLSITALPPGAATTAVTEKAAWAADGQNWRIPILAQSAGTVDACSVVGVSAATGAVSAANPPTLPDTVDVVVHGAGGQALACDVKAQAGNGVAWSFGVMAPAPNTDVQVALPDLSEVPKELSVTLVDVAAGKSLYARTTPSYVYNSGQGGTREFRLEVKPRTSAGLTLQPAGSQVRGNAAAITYVLSADAEVSARVLNVAGRLIRTLGLGSTVAAGTNTLTWDLTSEAQTRVPTGRYLVQIEAVTPDGQRATAVQSILVDR